MDQNMNMGTQMPEEKKPVGAMMGIIVIVLILAFGAYYFLRQVPPTSDTGVLSPIETQADKSISSLSTQGTSTNISDIQNDLNATDLSGVDAGLKDITI